jgi:phage terminase large subunit-like protein
MQAPALQNTFRNWYLNQWTQQSSRWIDLALWDANAGPLIDEEKLRGRTCYGMLDLATVSDMTAWVMLFPREDDPETVDVLARFFCPKARLLDTSNRYRDQYQMWERQGWLTATPGEATDYAFVKAQVLADAAKFRLVDMNVDRLFQAHQIASELAEEGIKVFGMGMGFVSMAAPMTELMRRLLAHKIRHGGNPILRWMADNVSVKMDPAGNLKPDKSTSQGKIDGIIGIAGGFDRLMRHERPMADWEAV